MTAQDVVFTFSHEMFDDVLGREFCRPPDQTLLALARDDRVGRLLVADGWRSYPVSVARRRPFRLIETIPMAEREVVRVRPHRLQHGEPTAVPNLERIYRTYGHRLGRALARTRGGSAPAERSVSLVTYHPFVAAFTDAPWIKDVVFVAQDDWATGEGVEPWWPAYREAYRRIEERKAAIFAVSEELANRLSPRTVVVPNGVTPSIWLPRRPAPDRITALPRPRAIYTGTVDDRLDRELVEQTVRTVGSTIFLGHPGDPVTVQWLRSLPNVHVLPSVGQVELAATVQACDLGLVPHRDQACIRAMSPLKLYEYVAAGLPVVSVDLPPIHGISRLVHISRQHEEWAPTLRRALEAPRATERERQEFIESVSWERRMRPVVDAAVLG